MKLTENEIIAIKQLHAGTANEELQKMAFYAIMMKICGSSDDTFDKDPYQHAHNSGRRSVAIDIMGFVNANLKQQ